MAGIDVGGVQKRNPNHDIPLIPFIDFLLCLVAFLLVTAVWSQMARIDADARVPGRTGSTSKEVEKQLHVEMRGDRKFRLLWKQGNTVVETLDVARDRVPVGNVGDFVHPELAKVVADQWRRHGSHRAPTDPRLDQAVLHTDNTRAFQDVVAVIDAIQAARRKVGHGGRLEEAPAFNVTFAVN